MRCLIDEICPDCEVEYIIKGLGYKMNTYSQGRKEFRMNIFVGNLSQAITEDDLRQAFEAFGEVASINVIKDRVSGRPRGFGFIEMPAKAEAQSAINGLNGSELKGQRINVNEARPRDEGRRGGRRRGGGRRF